MDSQNVSAKPSIGPVEGLDPMGQNTEAVVALHIANERKVSKPQRLVEAFTQWIARPWLFYTVTVLVGMWVFLNLTAEHWGFEPFDPAPFSVLQSITSICALFVAVVVLITQNRQGRVEQRRSQLDLQVNLLVDQRCAKIIEMLVEMRKDMPDVKDRDDPEAEFLKEAVDPHKVAEEIETRLESSVEEMMEIVEDLEDDGEYNCSSENSKAAN